jgi:hypothetical protein
MMEEFVRSGTGLAKFRMIWVLFIGIFSVAPIVPRYRSPGESLPPAWSI